MSDEFFAPEYTAGFAKGYEAGKKSGGGVAELEDLRQKLINGGGVNYESLLAYLEGRLKELEAGRGKT